MFFPLVPSFQSGARVDARALVLPTPWLAPGLAREAANPLRELHQGNIARSPCLDWEIIHILALQSRREVHFLVGFGVFV